MARHQPAILQRLLQASCARQMATSAALSNVEEPVPIQAELRDAAGTMPSERLRKAGRTPATLFSLPGNASLLLSLDSKEANNLIKGSVTHPVVPKQVHRNAVTEMIENITFLHCPEDRHVNVRVPVVVAGLELSPGARRGGWINTLFPAVRCRCPGGSIPPYLEVDVSGLNIGDSVRLEDLQLPPGVHVLEKALDMPVCKMRGTSGGGGQ